MSEPGYTYTTLSARPREPVQVGVSFYLDQHAWIAAVGIESGRPRLSISHGDVSVGIGPRAEQVTAEDARIACKLAGEAQAYATAVEQLSAGVSTIAAGVPAA